MMRMSVPCKTDWNVKCGTMQVIGRGHQDGGPHSVCRHDAARIDSVTERIHRLWLKQHRVCRHTKLKRRHFHSTRIGQDPILRRSGKDQFWCPAGTKESDALTQSRLALVATDDHNRIRPLQGRLRAFQQ